MSSKNQPLAIAQPTEGQILAVQIVISAIATTIVFLLTRRLGR